MLTNPNSFTEGRSADLVIDSLGLDTEPRLREILLALIDHLHAFVKDVQLTDDEWLAGINFLTAAGHMSSDTRQEFILLSDVLGVSMLVETINHRALAHSTEQTVLGPFHMVESPSRALGDSITLDGDGEHCLVTGTVTDINGRPVPGAEIDVWQANSEGFYDVQQPGIQPDRNHRGLFSADADGRFWLRTTVPSHYPIPTDGPVGKLLEHTGRHPYRPAHVHFLVSAPGYQTLTTHVFVNGSPYLDSDAVFGVKSSLIRDFVSIDDADRAAELGFDNPFRAVHFDVVLNRT